LPTWTIGQDTHGLDQFGWHGGPYAIFFSTWMPLSAFNSRLSSVTAYFPALTKSMPGKAIHMFHIPEKGNLPLFDVT
jgi:hypothetical protein